MFFHRRLRLAVFLFALKVVSELKKVMIFS
nr:MAG TPA: hypothetical protein [Caudoviricetes sp.]